jgi:hypothetical protein
LREFGTPTPLLASSNPPIVEVSTEPTLLANSHR